MTHRLLVAKPKYAVGQIVKVAISVPVARLMQGDLVSVIAASSKNNYLTRYKVLHLSGSTAWVDEEILCDPL